MFDDITYEDILARCLSAVPSDVDKREGSMIYDALAAGCLEIYNLYNDMNYAFEQSFPDTAESEYLDMLAADRGITRRGATAAVINVSFTGVDVPIGTRFSIDGNTYFVSSVNSDKTVYQLTCEQLGSEGNHASGSVLPIDDISGLKSASIIEISAAGEDEETDQSLRDRYSASVAAYTYGGNVSDYQETVDTMSGVGACKVVPAWQGGGTVLLILASGDYGAVSDDVLTSVKTALDPDDNGDGYGIAPIGHHVTVQSVTIEPVNFTVACTYKAGYTADGEKAAITSAISDYLAELAGTWESADKSALVVRRAQIESRVLGVIGIEDVTSVLINDAEKNYTLTSYKTIPGVGTVTVS